MGQGRNSNNVRWCQGTGKGVGEHGNKGKGQSKARGKVLAQKAGMCKEMLLHVYNGATMGNYKCQLKARHGEGRQRREGRRKATATGENTCSYNTVRQVTK